MGIPLEILHLVAQPAAVCVGRILRVGVERELVCSRVLISNSGDGCLHWISRLLASGLRRHNFDGINHGIEKSRHQRVSDSWDFRCR